MKSSSDSVIAIDGRRARNYAFDNLRAAMTLLGVAFHAMHSYMTIPATDIWPHKDQSTSKFCDFLILYFHAFRLPIFFLMSGFFCALLLQRLGPKKWFKNRIKRVVLPLALGWCVVYPITRAGFVFALAPSHLNPLYAAWLDFTSGALLNQASLIHLWFLNFLIYYYVLSVLILFIYQKLPISIKNIIKRSVCLLMESPFRIIYFIGVTWITLLPLKYGFVTPSLKILADHETLIIYGVFYITGWTLFYFPRYVFTFQKNAWISISVSFAVYGLYYIFWTKLVQGQNQPLNLAVTAALAIVMWTMTFGLMGLFVRYLNSELYVWRFLSDSSYWVYLMHMPLMIWIPALIAKHPWPAEIKSLITAISAIFVLFATYPFLVRNTWLGVLLVGSTRKSSALTARRLIFKRSEQ